MFPKAFVSALYNYRDKSVSNLNLHVVAQPLPTHAREISRMKKDGAQLYISNS